MTTGTTKIVIVAGQEFSVPAETDNEQIRTQLLAMGFADVASATIQRGTRDGVDTIEFVKKAGTKGLGGADLVALLAAVPPARQAADPLSRTARVLLRELEAGTLTIGRALAEESVLLAAIDDRIARRPLQTEGATLCTRVDALPAVPCATPLGW